MGLKNMQKQFKFYLFYALFVALLTAPRFTLANAGISLIVIFFNIGFIYPLVALIAVILVETVILKIILKTNYSKALIYSFSANIVSTVAGAIIYGGIWCLISIFPGIAMTVLLPLLYLVWMPPGASITYIITQILVSLAAAFLLSVYIEYLILKLFLKNFDKKIIKKGVWIVNLVSYILLAIVIVTVLLYQFQFEANKRNVREAEQQRKDVTRAEYINSDNWQTYKNTQYGFEFKYPDDFLIEEPKVFACSSPITLVGPKVCPNINNANGTFVNWGEAGKDGVFMNKKDINNVFFCQSFGLKNNIIYFAAKPENGDCFIVSLKIKEYQDCYELVEACPRPVDTDCLVAFQQKRTDCWDERNVRDQIIEKLSDTFKF
jgi:hypothetical protein